MSVCTYTLKRFFGEEMPKIPVSLPAFLGTAISLLLSFKLSQSYDRWWEARKVWGCIVNDCRTLVLQVLHFSNAAENEQTRAIAYAISFRQIAWAYVLGQSLRKLEPLGAAKRFISAEDMAHISHHQNKPLALLDLQSKDLTALYKSNAINAYQQVQIDNTLVRLCASMGRAERIRNTVFPVTYRQILRLFIYIFLVIMSFALLEINSIWEIPLDMLIALPFFMIEKTARHMQDPFMNKPTDTSVTSLAATIEINIKQIWKDEALPKPIDLKDKYYVL